MTKGSGFVAVGSRDGSVGVGGCSTEGGTGFLAEADGFALDGIRAFEVVTMAGEKDSPGHEYSVVFWAPQGI